MAKTNNFAVACYESKEMIIDLDRFSKDSIKNFVESNIELLSDSDNFVGTWVSDSKVYLDISKSIEYKFNAIETAKRYNQLAIFDLKTLSEIKIA